ncbi:hypothetical protein ACP70R_004109 [Stipagrostis hirtigluma subsp. patula]
MKRKASSAAFDEEDGGGGEPRRTAPRLDDYFLAEEILPRLPAHAAQGFAAASAFFRGILTDPEHWLSRLSRAPPPRPRAACLVVRGSNDDGDPELRHEFHYADAASSAAEPYAVRAAGASLAGYRHAGTCNGLVLLAAPWSNRTRVRAVLFNPASGVEEAVALDLPGGGRGGGSEFRCFCGLGYSPSSKTYKALICTRDFESFPRRKLMMLPLGGAAAGRQEVRTVSAVPYRFDGQPSSLSLDGKVYLLPAITAPEVLAFDVDGEVVTPVPLPRGVWRRISELMEVWGRPCIAMGNELASSLSVLTPEHQWERRCTLAVGPCRRWVGGGTTTIHGAWDCGDGLLFVMFRDGRGCMYDVGETAARRQDMPAAVAPAAKVSLAELQKCTFCWGYQPTLIPPATVFGDGACPSGFSHSSAGPRRLRESTAAAPRRCLEVLMEKMTRRRPLEYEGDSEEVCHCGGENAVVSRLRIDFDVPNN